MNLSKLRTELDGGHPDTGPYDADDAVAASQLNVVNRVRNVESVTGQQIFEAAVPDEYDTLSSDQKRTFLGIVGMGTILVNGPNTKAALLAMFEGGTETRSNLADLQTEEVSRAVELGLGVVAPGHVENARY